MKNYMIIPAVCLALLLSACCSDYPAKAAESAREYALKHTPELTEYQRNFIRYRDPVIMTREIFEQRQIEFINNRHLDTRYDKDTLRKPEYDFMHTAFVWDIPDVEGSIIVDGTSLRDLRYWEECTMVRKRFIPANPAKRNASKAAMREAFLKLKNITDDERLRLRFADPEIVFTNFDIELKDELEEARKKGGWMAYLKKAAEEEDPTQISLVWWIPNQKTVIVATGFSPDQSLRSWKPHKVFKTSPDELRKATVAKGALLK